MTAAATQVHEHPIIMTASSVHATIVRQKTATRRVVQLERWMVRAGMLLDAAWVDPGLGGGAYLKVPRASDGTAHRLMCPYGGVGDRLWVRETWRPEERDGDGIDGIRYAADDTFIPIEPTREAADRWGAVHGGLGAPNPGRWRSPIHMPRWASRLTLEITDIRIERIQDISEVDVLAEGIRASVGHLNTVQDRDGENIGVAIDRGYPAREQYHDLWDALNGKRQKGAYSWSSNPWVWVIEFRRLAA